MGLPVAVGTSVTGSLAGDSASYVWSVWHPVTSIDQMAETWRLQNLVNTACYWTWCAADTATGSNILASGALNAAAAQTVDALYGH